MQWTTWSSIVVAAASFAPALWNARGYPQKPVQFVVHVPFKGSAPALADTIGGQFSMMFDTLVTTVPQLKTAKYARLSPGETE